MLNSTDYSLRPRFVSRVWKQPANTMALAGISLSGSWGDIVDEVDAKIVGEIDTTSRDSTGINVLFKKVRCTRSDAPIARAW